ncbi:plastocyanin/azurin family copper-binding protein [Fodinibius sediminis]|nr:plastocyanin/azurin family copper-binding protein [Fodinibius sediminis]
MSILKKLIAFSVVILTAIALCIPSTSFAQDVKVVEMEGNDQLKFTQTEITAAPGQTITVKLTTVSRLPATAMAHNFVLLESTADATEVAQASARHADNEYIAPDMEDQIIAYTAMAGGGETVEVTFTAPETPGEYVYLCSFPGHFMAGMKGILTVE